MANEFTHDLTRRGFLGVAGLAALGAAGALVGCGEGLSSHADAREDNAASVSAEDSLADGSAANTAAPTESSPLVLVFSRAGENYSVGNVETGNTMVLAQMISKKQGAELFQLERVTPYPESYDACIDEAKGELDASARPELVDLPDLSGHDVVYLGFPCWWGDMPMPVYSAIEALDWHGKEIRPFNTHAGSGSAHMFETLAAKCEGALVTEGLTVAGTVAQTDRATAESQVDEWLARF